LVVKSSQDNPSFSTEKPTACNRDDSNSSTSTTTSSKPSSNAKFIPHLYGSTRFGDNVEDEWALAYLLWALSRTFPGLVIAMRDSDGEFLLIEASLEIPRWLTPDNSGNRYVRLTIYIV
jgi:hypothetical protein